MWDGEFEPTLTVPFFHWYIGKVLGEAVRVKSGFPAHEYNGPIGEIVGADGFVYIVIAMGIRLVAEQFVTELVTVTVYEFDWLASERFIVGDVSPLLQT